VHTPEYAFEEEEANVASGAKDLGITYPIAMDNGFSTWTNYRNRDWPAEYLIDQRGTVRHVKFGEGGYDDTERLIRQLLSEGEKNLPPAVEAQDTTPTEDPTPETYFGVGKVVNYRGDGDYDDGTRIFALPAQLPDDSFALRGRWAVDYQGITAQNDDNTVALHYHAHNVYMVVGGIGTVTVQRGGRTTTFRVSGPPNMRALVTDDHDGAGSLEVSLSTGLQAFSFTYG
jgi:hypothetical protein